MHYHQQHQHNPSCLMIWQAIHPRAVPEWICRGCFLCGGEGCKAGIERRQHVNTRTSNTHRWYFTWEGISGGRSTAISLLNRPCLQPASDCAPAFICAVLLYRYVIPMVQGINNLFSFFFPGLFLLQISSALQFTVQLHKQLHWCNRRAATRWGTSGQGPWQLKPTSLPKELITKLHP